MNEYKIGDKVSYRDKLISGEGIITEIEYQRPTDRGHFRVYDRYNDECYWFCSEHLKLLI